MERKQREFIEEGEGSNMPLMSYIFFKTQIILGLWIFRKPKKNSKISCYL